MLVPRTQLLFWFTVTVLPLALLGAAAPLAGVIAVLATLTFILIVLVDAVLAYSSLEGIQAELPEIVRFAKDREGTIDVKILHEHKKSARIRLGLPFPPEIHSLHEALTVRLSAEAEASRLAWPCTPLKRGCYHLRTCYVEGASPLGFWAMRGKVPVRSELRVYPDLSGERNNLAALFLNKGSFGIHAQRQVGQGREFEKLREYIPGDSFSDIHWKATAKRHRPISKVFQIERTQEVYVIIDTSRLSARTTAQLATRHSQLPLPTSHFALRNSQSASHASILERFITAALVMGLAAQKQGDLFGVVTFSDQIEGFVRAKSGKTHYSTCRDTLYTLQPKSVNPDFDELCTFLRLRLRRRALLVFLTNLDDAILAESFVKNMSLIHRQHLVLVNMLRPAAAQPLFSNQAVGSVDNLYHELGGHILWHDLRELERVLHHRGVNFTLLDNEKMCVDLVSQYINVKRRQLL